MRVLKPLILARRRQICAGPARREPEHPFVMSLPAEAPDLFDLRDESRAFSDAPPPSLPFPRRAAP